MIQARRPGRPGKSALEAIKEVQRLLDAGYTEVIDADLSGYFDSIPHRELMQCVARRVSDRQLLRLIKLWLEAPVEETDERGRQVRTTRNKDEGRGTPQGGVASPLLANATKSQEETNTERLAGARKKKTKGQSHQTANARSQAALTRSNPS